MDKKADTIFQMQRPLYKKIGEKERGVGYCMFRMKGPSKNPVAVFVPSPTVTEIVMRPIPRIKPVLIEV